MQKEEKMGSADETHFIPPGRRLGELALSHLGFLLLIAMIMCANATALHDMQAGTKSAGSEASQARNSTENVSKCYICHDSM